MKIYLAIPYTGRENLSFEIANKIAGYFMRNGHIVFSPISHSHPIVMASEMPGGWEFWKIQDEEFIKWADEIWVIPLPDWDESSGVLAEIKIANKLNKSVKFINDYLAYIYDDFNAKEEEKEQARIEKWLAES